MHAFFWSRCCRLRFALQRQSSVRFRLSSFSACSAWAVFAARPRPRTKHMRHILFTTKRANLNNYFGIHLRKPTNVEKKLFSMGLVVTKTFVGCALAWPHVFFHQTYQATNPGHRSVQLAFVPRKKRSWPLSCCQSAGSGPASRCHQRGSRHCRRLGSKQCRPPQALLLHPRTPSHAPARRLGTS